MAESIVQWLDKLGLGQYTQAFADNGVELDHLTHLTDDDLKELGLPLGPRRQLQAAVQTLFANQPPIRPSTPSGRDPPKLSAASSLSCSATWSARPSWRRGSIRRRWVG